MQLRRAWGEGRECYESNIFSMMMARSWRRYGPRPDTVYNAIYIDRTKECMRMYRMYVCTNVRVYGWTCMYEVTHLCKYVYIISGISNAPDRNRCYRSNIREEQILTLICVQECAGMIYIYIYIYNQKNQSPAQHSMQAARAFLHNIVCGAYQNDDQGSSHIKRFRTHGIRSIAMSS